MISQQPAGQFMPNFACGRNLVPNVSFPFWGLAVPGARNKGEMKFSLLSESMGNFCILVVFERYLSYAWTDPHQILLVYGQCLPTCPSPSVVHRPWGTGGRELKSQKWGVVSFVLRTATSSISLSVAKCGSIYRAQNCPHSDTESSRSAKAILQGVPKNSNFSPFREFTSLYLRNY